MKENRPKSVVHLLIRYSDVDAPRDGTINEHMKIQKQYGYVWFGKFGRRIGKPVIDELDRQIGSKLNSYLFLYHGSKTNEFFYISNILEIRKSIPREEILKVPAYYRDRAGLVKTWIKLGTIWKANKSKLIGIHGQYGMPLSDILSKSITGHLLVKTPSDFSPKKF